MTLSTEAGGCGQAPKYTGDMHLGGEGRAGKRRVHKLAAKAFASLPLNQVPRDFHTYEHVHRHDAFSMSQAQSRTLTKREKES